MIKIAHEAPLDIFDEVQRLTDYDYALVHLLEENGRYRDTFERAVKQGREVILDNSIFDDDLEINSKIIKMDVSNLELDDKPEKMNLNKMKVEDLRNLAIKNNKESDENIQKLKKNDLIKLLKDKK